MTRITMISVKHSTSSDSSGRRMRMSVGPNQGQKKSWSAAPYRSPKGVHGQDQGSRSSNSQSNPCICAGGSSAGGSRTPTWEDWTGQGSSPLLALAQELKSRPFQLTGATALEIVSLQRATTWLPWPRARGTCRQRRDSGGWRKHWPWPDTRLRLVAQQRSPLILWLR